jgi:N-acetyl-gamma-glutamyl-phosphate reductase
MALANQEAIRTRHEYIGTEHILLGLVKEGTGVAANVLKMRGLDLSKVYAEVERAVKHGPDMISMGKLPQTPRVKKVIEYAIQEARALGHNYVGTEHLLLGLIREHDGVAAQVLRNLGLKLEEVRKEILYLLGHVGDNEKPTTNFAKAEIVTQTQYEALAAATNGLADNTDSLIMQNSTNLQKALQTPAEQGKRIRVGIVGVSGYGGGEVLRLCATHPDFEVMYVAGESSAGSVLGQRFPGIGKLAGLKIEKWQPHSLPELDLLFASLPTGESKAALAEIPAEVKIVDIGGDHRYVDGWTYGLADVWPEKIRATTRVANPGCYPSAALAAIAPLIAARLVEPGSPIIIDAKSGVSGAGRGGADSKFGYAEVNEDVAAYGLLSHAHVREMVETINSLANTGQTRLTFTPHLIPMTRGILATCYVTGSATTQQCLAAAQAFYANRPFVRVVDAPPHTKWATGSNLVFVSYAAKGDGSPIVALGAIDNLGKGAAGQAVQNANLMCGLPETTGLEAAPMWP